MADAAPPVEAPKAKKKPNRLVVEEATNDDNDDNSYATSFQRRVHI